MLSLKRKLPPSGNFLFLVSIYVYAPVKNKVKYLKTVSIISIKIKRVPIVGDSQQNPNAENRGSLKFIV